MGLELRQFTASEVNEQCIRLLLPGHHASNSEEGRVDWPVEARAALLRRLAGFLCPCVHAQLVRTAVEHLTGLSGDADVVREAVEQDVEGLVASGDLQEHEVLDAAGRRVGTHLFASPPSFVQRSDGAIYLVGVVPDGQHLLPEEIRAKVHRDGFTRLLCADALDTPIEAYVREVGYHEISRSDWLDAPTPREAAALIREADAVLERTFGTMEGLRLMQPGAEASVTYYRGRWTTRIRGGGLRVGRRPQRFGADRWCLVRVQEDRVTHLLDLPRFAPRWRGCDDAWRLQAALDAVEGTPQRYRIRYSATAGTNYLDVFSPLPAWMQRRFAIHGSPVPRQGGSLFTYRVEEADARQLAHDMETLLWMQATEDSV